MHLDGQLTVHKRGRGGIECTYICLLFVPVCMCGNKNVGFKLLLSQRAERENSGRSDRRRMSASGQEVGQDRLERTRGPEDQRTSGAPPFCNLLPLSMCAPRAPAESCSALLSSAGKIMWFMSLNHKTNFFSTPPVCVCVCSLFFLPSSVLFVCTFFEQQTLSI